MAERRPLVSAAGGVRELPAGDTLPPATVPPVVAPQIHAAASKATPVDADELGIADSAASWALKKLTFANIKAWIAGLFVSKSGDTISGPLNIESTSGSYPLNITSGSGGNGRTIRFSHSDSTSMANYNAFCGGVSADLRASGPGYSVVPIFANKAVIESIGGSGLVASALNGTIEFLTGNRAKRGEFDVYGNFLLTGAGALGYGAGAGGSVTQATSKSTAVTLNKPCGLITTANSWINANTTVSFALYNNLIAVGDSIILTLSLDVNAPSYYNAWAFVAPGGGAAWIYIRNISAANQSHIMGINFAVIKGATS